jgi:hypothetical protein
MAPSSPDLLSEGKDADAVRLAYRFDVELDNSTEPLTSGTRCLSGLQFRNGRR